MPDTEFIKALTEMPSVGTACNPVRNLLAQRFGGGYTQTFVEDAFVLFQSQDGTPEDLEIVFIAHQDEVGGCVYGPYQDGFLARVWGNDAAIFQQADLQAFDWLAQSGSEAFAVTSDIVPYQGEDRLLLKGDKIRPYRTGFTFRETTTFQGDTIEGKALDPRVTLYAASEAVRNLSDKRVGGLFVMAEECAMDVARKAVTFLQKRAPNLRLIVNADVPEVNNLSEGRADLPAIRIFEGRNFIDPSFGIRTTDTLQSQGVEFHLSAARSGSQTLLFTPLAPTLSIALPSEGIHAPRYKMSLRGAERCIALLTAIGETALRGGLQ